MTQSEPTGNMSSAVCQQARHRYAFAILDWGLLPFLMVVTPLIYLFRAKYNLPLAANVDERTSLGILLGFHDGTLNPHFFLYPTLYYYVTYLFVYMFQSSQFLVWGRILNLSFVGLTAFVAYSFARLHFSSRAAGIMSAAFIIASPIIVNSGSYICPDPLLAATTLATLLFLIQYFQNRMFRSWLFAMLTLGLAVGCKYTAFLLFIAYVGTEMICELKENDRQIGRTFEPRIPRNVLAVAFAVLGCFFLTSAWVFPVTTLMRFASTHHTNVDLKSSADYLAFFRHVRIDLICGGVLLLGVAFLVIRSAFSYRLLSLRCLYLGLLIVLSVALLTTPYSVLDPSKFIYDIGAQARGTFMLQTGHAQWKNYGFWLLSNESKALITLGLVGFATVALKNYRQYLIVIVFATLYVLTIGSAHIGFPRYLTPLLPLTYLLAAGFLMQAWTAQKSALSPYAKTLAVILIVIATAELWPKIQSSRALSKQTDAFWSSYSMAVSMHPAKVLYAGYAPSVELSAAGISVSPISWANLAGMPMGNQFDCGELLIFDRRAAETHFIIPENDSSVVAVLDDRAGDFGQEVLRKADCK
jgi:hypothetical protein